MKLSGVSDKYFESKARDDISCVGQMPDFQGITSKDVSPRCNGMDDVKLHEEELFLGWSGLDYPHAFTHPHLRLDTFLEFVMKNPEPEWSTCLSLLDTCVVSGHKNDPTSGGIPIPILENDGFNGYLTPRCYHWHHSHSIPNSDDFLVDNARLAQAVGNANESYLTGVIDSPENREVSPTGHSFFYFDVTLPTLGITIPIRIQDTHTGEFPDAFEKLVTIGGHPEEIPGTEVAVFPKFVKSPYSSAEIFSSRYWGIASLNNLPKNSVHKLIARFR